jgi:hypothetical protein
MSDPADTGQRNPSSSGSSHASGTSGRDLTIPSEQAAPAAEQGVPNALQQGQGGDTTPMFETSLQGEAEHHQAEFAGQQSSDRAYEPDTDAQPEPVEYVAYAQPDAGPEPDYSSSPAEALQEAAQLSEAQQSLAETDAVHHTPGFAEDEPSATFAEDQPATFAEDEPAATFAEDETVESSDEPEQEPAKHAPEPAEPTLRVVPAVPLPSPALPEDTGQLRALARQTIAENEARQLNALAGLEQVSRRFTLALEEAGIDAARVSFKVMEFAQASMKNNLELAKAYAAARSVPDIFGLHAAYLARQFELLNAQAEELREIAAKMTLRSTASFKPLAEPVTLRDH